MDDLICGAGIDAKHFQTWMRSPRSMCGSKNMDGKSAISAGSTPMCCAGSLWKEIRGYVENVFRENAGKQGRDRLWLRQFYSGLCAKGGVFDYGEYTALPARGRDRGGILI